METNIRQTASNRVRVLDIPLASHHIFLSHEVDVLQEISAFMTVP
jgi:hypothetical protein